MIASINANIGRLVRDSDRAGYLLTWVLGYVDRDNARELSQLLNIELLLGKEVSQIEISQELTASIQNHITKGVGFDAAVNWLLMTAILLGEGE